MWTFQGDDLTPTPSGVGGGFNERTFDMNERSTIRASIIFGVKVTQDQFVAAMDMKGDKYNSLTVTTYGNISGGREAWGNLIGISSTRQSVTNQDDDKWIRDMPIDFPEHAPYEEEELLDEALKELGVEERQPEWFLLISVY